MKIVIDNKIPYIRDYAGLLGETVYLPGAEITAADVRDADALIVRTRTLCNRRLLENSSVRFIATATIGYDHIDTAWLRSAGIAWTNCPGCNARSVAQYVECSLLRLAAHGCWNTDADCSVLPLSATASPVPVDRSVFRRLTIAVVGVGHVGSQIVKAARRLGFGRILLCDPPRAGHEGSGAFTSFEEVARQADVISFHTPLTFSPVPHPTFHLASAEWFSRLERRPVLLNCGRGETVDTAALLAALKSGTVRAAVIDTWENEPLIDRSLLAAAFISTPHIAGYSADGKANGTRMSLQAVARHFGFSAGPFVAITPPDLPAGYAYWPEGSGTALAPELRYYDPMRDSLALKTHPGQFENFRGNYPLRREMPEF